MEPTSTASQASEFAVVVAGWFDGDTPHLDQLTTFLVRNGRIADISAGDQGAALAQRGLPVARGAFLLPGLVDAHVHLFLDGAPTDNKVRAEHLKQPLEQLTEAARRSARQALACGVTAVRDAGDRHGINNRIRDEALDPANQLPRVRSGGLGVKRPKRYGAFMATDVEDAEGIRQSVTRLAAANDEIKLILTGIIDFDAGAVTDEPQFSLDDTRLVVETARAHGRKVFAHCSGVKGLEIAARAGIGSVEHGFFMNREVLALMRDNQAAWTPTFCPVHFQWAHPEAVGWKPETVGNLRRILDDHAHHLAMAQAMGVTLLLGTDAGSMGVEHGYAVLEEIDRYLEAGLTLAQTLQAATANGRRYFDHEHATLRRGAPFDAVLLAHNPFEQLATLKRPLKVWPDVTGG
jgi:imidazolonepropionase-like amidohydrolase